MNRAFLATYLSNPIARWFWEHGGEEIVGPLGPLMSRAMDPHLQPWTSAAEPHPSPWKSAVAQLVQAAAAKEFAGKLQGPQKAAALKSADAAIEAILDDWGCGTPPRVFPWPWPGPPPWVWEIASELSFVANSLAGGGLRDQLTDISSKIAGRISEGMVRG